MTEFIFYTETQAEFAAIKLYKSASIEELKARDFKHIMNIMMLCFPKSVKISRIILTLNELGNNDLPADSHEIDFATTSWRQIFIDQAQFVLNKTFDSIIDVGCGNGDLMRALQKHPHLRVSGIEHPRYQGSRWHEGLDVKYHDLSNKYFVRQKYDIAICNEVAEHIDPEKLSLFVESLVNLSDIIILGASLFRQPGDGHIACKKASWWKNTFMQHNYEQLNIFRIIPDSCKNPCIWDCFAYVNNEKMKELNNINQFKTNIGEIDIPSPAVIKSAAYTLLQLQEIINNQNKNMTAQQMVEYITKTLYGPNAAMLEIIDQSSNHKTSKVWLPKNLRLLPTFYK